MHEHDWKAQTVEVRGYGKNKASRLGFRCAECRLIALPPKNEQRLPEWKSRMEIS